MHNCALIISTSLDNGSHSRLMANALQAQLTTQGVDTTYLDCRHLHLPHAASDNLERFPDIQQLREAAKEHDRLFFAAGIYNYTVAASAKNCLEVISNDLLEGKTAGFMFAAGGNNGYMAGLSFMNAFMLDFSCWVAPQFVYANRNDFKDQQIISSDITQRVNHLAHQVMSR